MGTDCDIIPCTCKACPGVYHDESCPVYRYQEQMKTMFIARPEQVRGTTHGDYSLMSGRIQAIKDTMRSGPSWDQMTADQREALDLIATKIGRIVCGDPNHRDHWADIAGYANLAHNRIPQAKK